MIKFPNAKLLRQLLPSTGAVALVIALNCAGDASAAININPLGDSITLGVNDVAPQVGGYRFYFEDLAASNPLFDLNFIGNRLDGSGTDTNHWGQGAAQAQNDRNLATDAPSMLRAVHNVTADPTSNLAAFDPSNGKLDAMFIHAGTNSVPGGANKSNSTGAFGLDNAFNSMKNLLLAGTTGVTADVSGASFTTINGANGVHAQLNNSSVANSQAHVFVAGIIPLFEDFGLYGGALDAYNGVGKYNNQVKNLLDTNATLNDPSSAVNYHYVDMFSITVDELDHDWLAGLFTGGNVGDLIALISPEAEIGGTDFVDWGLGFDESAWDEGALGADEVLYSGFNTNLLGDGVSVSGVHPTDMGYAIMANVWYNASAGILVPEPSSVIFVLAGSTLLLSRRRRSSHL